MSYRPSAPRLIPSHRRTHECSPASLGRRVNSRLSRDGSDSGHSQGWNSPRPRSSASRSSGGHSSDLIFPMDSEPGSDSSSSRQGSVEPDFLYETPRGNQAVWNPAAMPVCSRCGRLYHGHVPPPGLDRAVAICPSCSLRESRERVEQRAPDDDFYNTTGYHLYRGRATERYIPSHVPQQQGYDPRTRRQRVNSTATHVIARPFPSYVTPASTRRSPPPCPPSAWVTSPPHATPVRSQPASNITRPRTADPCVVSSSSRYTHHRRQ